MRIPFRPLPGLAEPYDRPVVLVDVDGVDTNPFPCLLDTGALGNRFGQWVADVAGIDLAGASVTRINVGGMNVTGRTTLVDLGFQDDRGTEDHRWTTEVTFCDPWPWDFQLLGQEGFFRYFHVCFDAAELTLDVEPAAQ